MVIETKSIHNNNNNIIDSNSHNNKSSSGSNNNNNNSSFELIHKITVESWRTRESPLQWSMKLSQLQNKENGSGRIICDILLKQMLVGPSPSPLLVSYLRYAISMKMINYTDFFNSIAELSSTTLIASKPKQFNIILSVLLNVTKILQSKSTTERVINLKPIYSNSCSSNNNSNDNNENNSINDSNNESEENNDNKIQINEKEIGNDEKETNTVKMNGKHHPHENGKPTTPAYDMQIDNPKRKRDESSPLIDIHMNSDTDMADTEQQLQQQQQQQSSVAADEATTGDEDLQYLKKRKNQLNTFQTIYDISNTTTSTTTTTTNDTDPILDVLADHLDNSSNNDKNNNSNNSNNNILTSKPTYLKHLTSIAKVIILLIQSVISALEDEQKRIDDNINIISNSSQQKQSNDNALECMAILSNIISNNKLSSLLFYSKNDIPDIFNELVVSFYNLRAKLAVPSTISVEENVMMVEGANPVAPSPIVIIAPLRNTIQQNYPQLMRSIYNTLFSPFLPTTEIQALVHTHIPSNINNNEQSGSNATSSSSTTEGIVGDIDINQSLALQLLFEEEITGNTLTRSALDSLYKFDWIRSIRAIPPTTYLFELLKISFQRLTTCNPMSNEYKKVKMFILIKIPLFYKTLAASLNNQDIPKDPHNINNNDIYNDMSNTNITVSIEDAILQITQIPSLYDILTYNENVLLNLVQLLVKRNLITLDVCKEKLSVLNANGEIDQLESDLQPVVKTADDLGMDFHIQSLVDIELVKESLFSLNDTSETYDMQTMMSVLRTHLIGPNDFQDNLIAIVFEKMDTLIDPMENKKLLSLLFSILADPLILETIDIHGYSLKLMIHLIRYCSIIGQITNSEDSIFTHSFFALPFSILTTLIILYNLKGNQYNLDQLHHQLKLENQDLSYQSPFVSWIFDSFKDTEINFGNNYREGVNSDDYRILKTIVELNRDEFTYQILNEYSPWKLVQKLPELLYLLCNSLEKNLTSIDSIVEMLLMVIDIVPYASIVIFQFISKNPNTIPIEHLLNCYTNPDGSDRDNSHTINLTVNNSNLQIYHHIPETLNLILFPILYKFPFQSNPNHSILYNQNTPNQPTQLNTPQSIISELFEGFKTKFTEIPKDLLLNIISRTDLIQFIQLISKKVLSTISSSNESDPLSINNTIRTIELGGFLIGNLVGIECIPILFNSFVPSFFNSLINSSHKAQYLAYFCQTVFIHSNCHFYIQINDPFIKKALSQFFQLLGDCAKRFLPINDPQHAFVLAMISLFIYINKSLNLTKKTINNTYDSNENNNNNNVPQTQTKEQYQSVFSILSRDEIDQLSNSITNISNYFMSASIYEYREDHHLYNNIISK